NHVGRHPPPPCFLSARRAPYFILRCRCPAGNRVRGCGQAGTAAGTSAEECGGGWSQDGSWPERLLLRRHRPGLALLAERGRVDDEGQDEQHLDRLGEIAERDEAEPARVRPAAA